MDPPASPIQSVKISETSSASNDSSLSPSPCPAPPAVEPALVLQEHNAAVNAHSMSTRAKSGISKPNPRYVLLTVKGIPVEPKTVATELKHPWWNGAMGEEIDTCHETQTWSLVPPPTDFNVLGYRWDTRQTQS